MNDVCDSYLKIRESSIIELNDNISEKGRYSFLEVILNYFPFPQSKLYQLILKLVGIQIGSNVKITGRIFFKIRGKPSNIVIHNNVTLCRGVDLRNRENGMIILHNNVFLDNSVRLVAAREGIIEIGFGTAVGCRTIINSGGKTQIGQHCLIASNVNINSSSHGINRERFIKDQTHQHGYVIIGDDVWIGSGASLLMNTKIGEGGVIATNAVARKEYPPFSVSGGVPAKVLKFRS